MTIFDLIWLSDVTTKINFSGDGVDYFDNELTITAINIPVSMTANVNKEEIETLIEQLDKISQTLKDYLS